jgi:hypothetical protein
VANVNFNSVICTDVAVDTCVVVLHSTIQYGACVVLDA